MQVNVARLVRVGGFMLALGAACAAFGAVPWVAIPTLVQAVWASGFALSFANGEALSIYATDFGFPHPAPIAFGLSATLLQAVLIRHFAIHALDAYTLVVVFYFALALWGAGAYARQLGASRVVSLSFGLLWLSLPLVVHHAGFSMLALGFALLPFYFHTLHRVLHAQGTLSMVTAAVGLVLACVLSVFMDGYTFVMFGLASGILLVGAFATNFVSRRMILLYATPCAAVAFGTAYVLYDAYVGHPQFRPVPLEFFRGWGVDVAMLLVPTYGMHWLWDKIGLSVPRTPRMYWGDASVWITTFIAPLLVSGLAGFAIALKRKYAVILFVMALTGIYLSLGPSLKFNSTKQVPGITSDESGPLMPAKYAIGATGSSVLSENAPGFNLMRASYRWLGLGALGLWGLTILLVLRLHNRWPMAAASVAPLLILMLLPHTDRLWSDARADRIRANAMEAALVGDFRDIAPSGVLFIAPHGNDFLANYLAPLAGFTTPNIGGDKNVEIAHRYWDESLLRLNAANLQTHGFVEAARTVLLTGQADAIVMPYFDMLWAPYRWPPSPASVAKLRDERLPIARETSAAPCFQVIERAYFVAVKLTEYGRQLRDRVSDLPVATEMGVQACTGQSNPLSAPAAPEQSR